MRLQIRFSTETHLLPRKFRHPHVKYGQEKAYTQLNFYPYCRELSSERKEQTLLAIYSEFSDLVKPPGQRKRPQRI